MSIITFTPISKTAFPGKDSAGSTLGTKAYSYTGTAVVEKQVLVAEVDTAVTSGTQSSATQSFYTVDKLTNPSTPAFEEATRIAVETEVSSGKVESTYSINTLYTEVNGGDTSHVLNTAALFRSTGMYVRAGKGDNTSDASTISLDYEGVSFGNTDSAIYLGGTSNFCICFRESYPTVGKNALLFEAYDSGTATWIVQSSMERTI